MRGHGDQVSDMYGWIWVQDMKAHNNGRETKREVAQDEDETPTNTCVGLAVLALGIQRSIGGA